MALPVSVIELCKITPPPESATQSSLPLTFFDTFWLKFHPVERIFFYQLTAVSSSSFFPSILPKLKQSLSLTLLHFLPFPGNLVWPADSDKPSLLYIPGHGVSLTVAESNADFDAISGHTVREITDSHQYVPELEVTETEAETMSFQITFFPGKGFSIGVSSHHAVFDGKSIVLFLKSWAYICKHMEKDSGSNPTLPPELTPFLDRTVIQDPEGLDMVYLNDWTTMAFKYGVDTNSRSLKLLVAPKRIVDKNLVRGTFILSSEHINKIRHKAVSQLLDASRCQANSNHFSTFVLVYSYVGITIAKAKMLDGKKTMFVAFTADVRTRLDPPIAPNYFGNCVSSHAIPAQVENVIKEDGGLGFLAEGLAKVVKGLQKGALDGAKEKLSAWMKFDPTSMVAIGVAGSPRFGVYGTDFGWGKPKKVEVTSIDRSTTFSIAERSDGNDGVEIGVVLKKDEMELFASLFRNGLEEP